MYIIGNIKWMMNLSLQMHSYLESDVLVDIVHLLPYRVIFSKLADLTTEKLKRV